MTPFRLSISVLPLCLLSCLFDGGGNGDRLTGTWDHPYSAFYASSIRFDNKEGIDTRNPYDRFHSLDSNSCKNGDSLDLDTSYATHGTWTFHANGTYTHTLIYIRVRLSPDWQWRAEPA